MPSNMHSAHKEGKQNMRTTHGKNMRLMHIRPMHLNIKAFRKARGLNQEAMADAMGVEQSNISRFESGKTQPSLDTLCRAADHFECSVGDFFNPIGGDGEASSPRPSFSGAHALIVREASAAATFSVADAPALALSFYADQGEVVEFLLTEAQARQLQDDMAAGISDLGHDRRERQSSSSHPSSA